MIEGPERTSSLFLCFFVVLVRRNRWLWLLLGPEGQLTENDSKNKCLRNLVKASIDDAKKDDREACHGFHRKH